MSETLCLRRIGQWQHIVEKRHLASELGSGLVAVFSTPMLVAGMEAAAVNCIESCLDYGITSVGVHIDVSHKAPTPEGELVRFEAELTHIGEQGRKLAFKVRAYDSLGLIGEGTHERFLVNREKFESRALVRKAANQG